MDEMGPASLYGDELWEKAQSEKQKGLCVQSRGPVPLHIWGGSCQETQAPVHSPLHPVP